MLPWVAAFSNMLAIHGVLFSCPGGSPGFQFYEAWQVLLPQHSWPNMWGCFEVWGSVLELSHVLCQFV